MTQLKLAALLIDEEVKSYIWLLHMIVTYMIVR